MSKGATERGRMAVFLVDHDADRVIAFDGLELFEIPYGI